MPMIKSKGAIIRRKYPISDISRSTSILRMANPELRKTMKVRK
jgi:hypothetical protein